MNPIFVRANLAQALSATIEDRGQRVVGNIVGHVASTISRWGADMTSWSAAALIDLAAADPAFLAALTRACEDLREEARRAVSPTRAAISSLTAAADLAGDLCRSLSDGRIDKAEAADLQPLIRRSLHNLTTLQVTLHSGEP
jgi:hypothetical protein